MSTTVRQTGSLLRAGKGRTFTYFSVTKNRWIMNATDMSLADICGLNSEERDTLLDYFRASFGTTATLRARLVDMGQKTG